jgi:hypothetical protein
MHVGPPIHAAELVSAHDFLRQSDFSPASDYYSRLAQIQHRLSVRSTEPALRPGKRNYGGEAAGRWMQVQSAYDHVIVSTCYEGEFNFKRGRIKLSHRFNLAGRIDFVELKFLRSLDTLLDGAIRKLLTVQEYQDIRKDWRTSPAYVLQVLPQELIFLFEDVFRCDRSELFAWLINIGHGMVDDLWKELRVRPLNGDQPRNARNPDQMCLLALRTDDVAAPILEKVAALDSAVAVTGPKSVIVRYQGR